jgi:hypothetical protein
VLLRRLSVLPGGFSLDAAGAVAGDDVDLLPALSGLVEQSLLTPVPIPGDRYRALEPVRQYAASHLADSGEAGEVADRAAGFFADLAVEAGAQLRTAGQASALDRLAVEHDHLAGSLDRLIETRRFDAAARVAGSAWLYWALRGDAVEGLGRFERVAQAVVEGAVLSEALQAGLQLGLAGLRLAAGDPAGAGPPAAEAVRAARASADREHLPEALVLTGMAALFCGDTATAERALAEGLERASTGGGWAAAHVRIAQAQLLMSTGDLAGTAAALAEAEACARALGSPFTLATVLNMQASVAQAVDDDATALTRLEQAAELARRGGLAWTLVYTLPALAVVAARRGQHELAAELFAAGWTTADDASLAVSFPPDVARAEHWLRVTRERLDPSAFEAAWTAGRRLAPAEVAERASRISRSP